MVKKKACIFISGRGSNLSSILKRSREYNFPVNIKLVISNNSKAKGLLYAKKNSIPWLIVDTKKRNYENQILMEIKKWKVNLICLAGYMRIISKDFIRNFGNDIINIHPSLLPKFKGLDTFQRILKSNEIKTGCTVHYVNEKLDDGKIIVKKSFFINENDDLESLRKKTQTLEYKAYSEALIKIFRYI